MKPIIADPKLVAYCGLYCGACKKYLKGSCPGCADNDKASWCKVRQCCIQNGYTSCAECKDFPDVLECKQFNNFFSKIFAFIFKSDRKACINKIKDIGVDDFSKYMAEQKLISIKK